MASAVVAAERIRDRAEAEAAVLAVVAAVGYVPPSFSVDMMLFTYWC